MSSNRISIIMATFNRAHLIEYSLNSILNQCYKDFECIIIDDGSTDNTSAVVNSFIKKESRFKYFKRTADHKKGLAGCRNQGLDIATGDYIIFYDDDDLVHPKNLEVNLKYLTTLKKDFCNYQKKPFFKQEPLMDGTLKKKIDYKKFDLKHLDKFITGERAMSSCTVMWSEKCFKSIRFNEELSYAEEWECYARILMAGYEGVTIEEVLYFNRKHPYSNTGRFDSGNFHEKESMSRAARLMIANLAEYDFLTPGLEKYFIRLAFKLKDYELLEELFNCTNPNSFKKFKYKKGFQLYPLIRPIFKIKAKLVKS